MDSAMLVSLLLMAVGYLLGSIPTAYLVARARGIDVFVIGTGNPGAANVFREIGRGPGTLVLLVDALKGALPVLAALLVSESGWTAWSVGVAAQVGHWYPLWLRFRGGAGLATGIGVGVAIMPLPAFAALAFTLMLLYFWRSVGHVAAVGYLAFFVVAVALGEPPRLGLAIVALPGLALTRERLLPRVGTRDAA